MLEILRQVSAAGRAAGPHSPFFCHAHKARARPAAPLLAPRAEEHEIAAVAQHCVSRVRAHVSAIGRRNGLPETVDAMRESLDAIARGYGARPVPQEKTLSGRIGRMLDPAWWRRNLRHQLLQQNEAIEHAQQGIRRKNQCYVSEHAMKRNQARAKAIRIMLEAMEVANEDGEAYNLAQVADASISNPALRRSELMVRCRGFEEVATFMGHEAVLLTITLPSRYHRFDRSGQPNKKWSGATPRDGQDELNKTWSKIRAEWKRRGFQPYGFRVAEPHHDACPHWHILLFAPAEHMGWFVPHRFIADRADAGAGLVGVAGAYALAEAAGEAGAAKHRFKVDRIDPEKGGATGYIAKYISKNIDGKKEDGSAMGLDYASGTTAQRGAKRVRTWSQVWKIRQFQQVGGPSVTVWRELRRLGKGLDEPLQLDLFEGPRAAADRALWALFWVLQGGPDVARADLTLKPFYSSEGEGKYGEVVKRVKGVEGFDAEAGKSHDLVTRLHTWTVQRAGLADVNAHWDRFHGADKDFYKAYEALALPESDFEGREATPWTGVNNCTAPRESDEAAELYDDYLRSLRAERQPEPPPVGNRQFERMNS